MRAAAGMLLCAALLVFPGQVLAQDAATYATRNLTLETALKAARAALKKCRDSGWQAAVAVVDRSGVVQVVLRDRYAGPHTPRTAGGKAWTAASFRSNTGALVDLTQPGKAQSGVRHLPHVVVLGGGVIIEGGGQMLGAIGVSGAPGGEADEACAKAGIAAIQESLEF
ncbi:MAG: heme-binding protein [Betaproteobacteria bacterium]|nr:MAG: heme-binding protein [Betaproteobacteria bacterium]